VIQDGVRPGWDDYWLNVALAFSVRAACTHRRIGAIVVRANRLLGSGYNGVAAGELNCSDGGCPRGQLRGDARLLRADYSDCEGIHAEWNAMMDAGRVSCAGSTLYVNASLGRGVPCHLCRKLAKGAGITAIVWEGESGSDFVQLSRNIDAVESVQLRRLKRRWEEQGQKMTTVDTGDLL
jgi:dCMP deaminase